MSMATIKKKLERKRPILWQKKRKFTPIMKKK